MKKIIKILKIKNTTKVLNNLIFFAYTTLIILGQEAIGNESNNLGELSAASIADKPPREEIHYPHEHGSILNETRPEDLEKFYNIGRDCNHGLRSTK